MQNRVVRNACWIICCKVVQSIVNFIIGMISARYLGPSNYGLITYAASIVAFMVPIMQLGLTKTIVLDIIERPDKEGMVLGTALLLNIISSIACIIAVFGYLYSANHDAPTAFAVGMLYSVSLFFQATEILQYWFQAKLLSKYTAIASLSAYFVVAAYKVFLLVSGRSVLWFAIANSIDYVLIFAFLLILYRRNGGQKLSFSLPLGKEMLKRSKHYIVSTMMVTIFQQTDRIMLKEMINETETGYYSAAIACVGITGFIFSAIIDSFRPDILSTKGKSVEEYERKICTLYSIITYLALFQCVVMTLLAKPIVLILYGSQFADSIALLRVAVWYSTFSYYGAVRNIWILAEGKQEYLWRINLSGALLNILLNAGLIPRFGAIGAAVASLATQFFTNVIIGFIIKPIRYSNRLMILGLNPKPLISIGKRAFKKIKDR